MAAYPYYPINYNYPNYLPVQYQPVLQQQQAPAQQSQAPSTSGIIWVSGANEAQMYPVAPNNAVALWEQSGKTIYLKSADATGKPAMKVYDLLERTETASAASSASEGYITREDLNDILAAIKGITGEMEQMKADLYGVAGRKRTAKKTEMSDDE